MLRQIHPKPQATVISIKKNNWKRIAAAAAIIITLGTAAYLLNNRNHSEVSPKDISGISIPGHDIASPTKSKATITLADGSVVALDSAIAGTLATQGNVLVSKTKDGKIIYEGSSSPLGAGGGRLAFNTLSNPRGSKVINITLADGSRVWLNAGSSISYPVAFVGKERNVTITGEAYFEVTHNAVMPFKVSKGEMEVTVLGTHFNVNAYDDEEHIKVTLLEGSVRVVKGDLSGLLKPGQQAQINSAINLTNDVDVEAVMAWKNGLFQFKSSDLPSILREAARWYNMDIVYRGNVSGKFSGQLSRMVNASELFKILESTGELKVIVEKNKVIVTTL